MKSIYFNLIPATTWKEHSAKAFIYYFLHSWYEYDPLGRLLLSRMKDVVRCLIYYLCSLPSSDFSTKFTSNSIFWTNLKNTFECHASCTDGEISVRINFLFYLFFTVVLSNTCVFLSCRPFVVKTTFSTGLLLSPVTTKCLQGRNAHVLNGTTVKNRYNN